MIISVNRVTENLWRAGPREVSNKIREEKQPDENRHTLRPPADEVKKRVEQCCFMSVCNHVATDLVYCVNVIMTLGVPSVSLNEPVSSYDHQ